MFESNSSKLVIVVIVMLVGGLFLFKGQSGETPKPDDAASKEQTTAAATNPGGKILRMGVAGTPKIDPGVGSDAASALALVNVYDTLVYPLNEGGVKPALAEKWEISSNNLEYTFSLRKGVKFHNGDEVKASDVAFSAKRLMTMGEGFSHMFKGIVKSVEALDDYTVKFNLEKPLGPFINTLIRLYVLNEKQVMANIDKTGNYGEFGDYGRNWLLTHDAGSGPYMVTELKQRQHMLAERFKDYWEGWENADAPDTIKLMDSAEPATTRTMMEKRELEITDEYQSSENVAAMSKIPGVSVGWYSNGGVQNIMYNTKKAPTDDVNFRKAMNYLFDYNMIVDKVFVGSVQAKGPVAAGVPGAAQDLNQFKHDPEKAKEFLAKSKYAGKLDQYPVEFLLNSSVADTEKIALALQAAAEPLGIKIKISKATWLSIIEQVSKVDSTPNMLCITVSPSYMDAGSMLLLRYHSRSTGSWEQAEWLQDKHLDSMIEEAMGITDNDKRFEKYHAIQKYIVDDVTPSGWLVDLVKRCVYQSEYVYWPAAEKYKAGNIVTTLPMGYPLSFKEFKVFPDKIKK